MSDRVIVDDDPLDREIDFSNAHANSFAKHYGRNRNLRISRPIYCDLS